jgi:cysteine synthase A
LKDVPEKLKKEKIMSITIYVNGKKQDADDGMNISKLLDVKRIKPEVVVVELNDKIVERQLYNQTTLKANDKLEFVYYMGGGQTRSKVAENILELIGNTPMVKLNKIVDSDAAQILGKLESYNPGGSVKDRICLAMIEDAQKRGLLKPGATIIEPTSGNTGIGLAMICAIKGYKCILTMPETMSLERIYILRSYGAQIVLTAGQDGMMGSIKKAEELLKKIPNSFMPHQFNNKANPQMHRQTTAKEILEAVDGTIDGFVAGVGTGGTITGVGEVLKKHNPHIKIVAVEPKTSAVLSGNKPGPHKIQGIGAGFVPDILNRKIIDEIIQVDDNDAFKTSRRLAMEEGLFVGISAGAAVWAAIKVAKDLGKNKRVVVILPDTGERYFSMEQYFEA